MVKTPANPGGLPKADLRRTSAQLAANRRTVLSRPRRRAVLRLQPAGHQSLPSVIVDNWWRQGMMGGAKAHYDGIVAFSQTDFTADLKKIDVPVLVMHGDDDQIVPYADSGPLVGQAPEERDAREPTRAFRTACRRQKADDHQRRPARVHPVEPSRSDGREGAETALG